MIPCLPVVSVNLQGKCLVVNWLDRNTLSDSYFSISLCSQGYCVSILLVFIQNVALPQMHDYVTRYKPEYIWSDGDAGPTDYWMAKEFLAWLYSDRYDNLLESCLDYVLFIRPLTILKNSTF